MPHLCGCCGGASVSFLSISQKYKASFYFSHLLHQNFYTLSAARSIFLINLYLFNKVAHELSFIHIGIYTAEYARLQLKVANLV